jgi:hypothetical protein
MFSYMSNCVCLQDMVSSDEDIGGESDGRWMQLPSNVQSPTAQAAKEEPWEDPICKLFQEPPVSENHHENGSAPGAGATVEAEAGCSYQSPTEGPVKAEVAPAVPSASSAAPTAPLALPPPPLSRAQRLASFLDMGFAFDVVDRAFKQHGEWFTSPYVKLLFFLLQAPSLFVAPWRSEDRVMSKGMLLILWFVLQVQKLKTRCCCNPLSTMWRTTRDWLSTSMKKIVMMRQNCGPEFSRMFRTLRCDL